MNVVTTENLRKEFGTLVAVNDVNLSVDKGHIVGLIGPNGAGKTTLLRMLATLMRQTDGGAEIFGFDIGKQYLDIRAKVGYLPDFFNLYNDLTLHECLEFFASAYKVERGLIAERVRSALCSVDLENKKDDFIRHLSRGMVQRLGVAVLLVREPELLLLDEPASGLDPKARIQLRNILRGLSNDGKTIIISSHILTELSGFCTHIAIMNEGKIILYGAVDEIERELTGFINVEITVVDDGERAIELLKSREGIKIASTDNNRITVQMDGGLEKMAELNGYLVTEGIKVASFSERKTDLEDVFMRISSEE